MIIIPRLNSLFILSELNICHAHYSSFGHISLVLLWLAKVCSQVSYSRKAQENMFCEFCPFLGLPLCLNNKLARYRHYHTLFLLEHTWSLLYFFIVLVVAKEKYKPSLCVCVFVYMCVRVCVCEYSTWILRIHPNNFSGIHLIVYLFGSVLPWDTIRSLLLDSNPILLMGILLNCILKCFVVVLRAVHKYYSSPSGYTGTLNFPLHLKLIMATWLAQGQGNVCGSDMCYVHWKF